MLLAPRHLSRLSSTVGLFTRYGLADFAKQQGLSGLGAEPEAGDDHADSPERAEAFRKRLVELGPAYVKLGQVLSTRPDLLPPSYIKELETLQDDVEPIAVAEVVEVIERELGARLSKLFDSFDETPLGAASLGQVHAAEMRGGLAVVIKVQRPHIREILAGDLEFFQSLAHFMTEHTSAGNRVDMIGIVEQLERALRDELDYRVEARNAAMFRRSLAKFPRIIIPRVIGGYSTEHVLTTERIRGTKVSDLSPLVRIEHDFHVVADELTRAYLEQIAIDGHFHADPHPGNVFVVLPSEANPLTPAEVKALDRRNLPRPARTQEAQLEAEAEAQATPAPPDVDVKIAMIDFGMTARLSGELQKQVVRLLLDIVDNRGDSAAAVLIEMGEELSSFDRPPYVRDVAALVARSYQLANGDLDAGHVLHEVLNISYQRGLRLPGELTLFAKTLVNLDALTKAIDPTYSPIPTLREYGARIATEQARKDLNPRHVFQASVEAADLAMALPHRLDVITSRMASNEFAIGIDAPQVMHAITALQKVANRIFSGLVLAGLLVASAMLLPYHRSMGTSGFVLAAAIGIWMVLSIIWSDRSDGDKV